MIKIEHVEAMGWEHAIRGMRNPKNSWYKSDSWFNKEDIWKNYCVSICPNRDADCHSDNVCCDRLMGPNDRELMYKLSKAGADHRKYMRMIPVYMDVTAPLYWWKEYDTYKVGTVANSCSSMHTLCLKKFELDDFSHEHLLTAGQEVSWGDWVPKNVLEHIIMVLNKQRDLYLETNDKKYWWQIIQLLPTSYNQRRTEMLNYETLAKIYPARKDHRLDEWGIFCKRIEALPFSGLFTGKGV